MQTITSGIHQLAIPMRSNPLRKTYAYLLEEARTLVDTGVPGEKAIEALEKQLGQVELEVSEMRLEKRINGVVVLSHPELDYQVSPYLLGAAQCYFGSRYKDSHVYADPREGRPLVVRAKSFGERYSGCAMLVSPYIEDPDRRPKP